MQDFTVSLGALLCLQNTRPPTNVHGTWQTQETGHLEKYPPDNYLWLEDSLTATIKDESFIA